LIVIQLPADLISQNWDRSDCVARHHVDVYGSHWMAHATHRFILTLRMTNQPTLK